MQWGINLPTKGDLAHPDAIRIVAEFAEARGLSTVWASEHIAIPHVASSTHPGDSFGANAWDPAMPWFEPLLSLCWAAAYTERIRLGTSILVLPLRPTLLVAKLVASLDQLSRGRVVLGVGSGWLEEEFTLLGESFSDRGKRMTEAIRLLREAWSREVVEFDGEFHASIPFGAGPKPFQHGGVPVLVGGHSERALQRVAAVGDGWHPSGLGPDQLQERLNRLDAFLEQRGRSRTDLRFVVRCPPATKEMSAAEVADLVTAYQELGADELLIEIDYADADLEASLQRVEALDRILKACI